MARTMTQESHLETVVMDLLSQRGTDKTICPSEVARLVAATDRREDWEPLMGPVRAAAQRLVRDGKIEVTQKGKVVDGETAKGPIRLRRTKTGA